MAKRISLSELIEKTQNKKLTESEAKRAFSVQPNPHQPFDFNININPSYVDVTGFEALARNADDVMRGFSGPSAPRARARKAAPRRIVAEGDSWFRLPFFYPDTSIDVLQDRGYPVDNLGHWGDTLDEMLSDGQFWPYIDAGYDLLLFSGGGNDVLGNGGLASFLNLYDPHHNKPSDAPYYVRQEFYDNLALVASNIETGLVVPMKNRHAGKTIVMHGYDYVIPVPNGPWLGGPMMYQGLHPVDHKLLCRAIIRLMIDAYNLKLKALAAKYAGVFIHLDLRGTVKDNEWVDELHGKDAAARKIATRFAAVIDTTKVAPIRNEIARLYLPASAAA
jgi:hypothetical protein